MTATVNQLWRYPIKSLGRETIKSVELTQGLTMPWDRTWAVTHENSRIDPNQWARCGNFLRVASSPELAAVTAELDETAMTVTLKHPKKNDLTVCPHEDPESIVEWAAPLITASRAKPTGVVRVPNRGMTDSKFPSVSIANLASHRAVAQKLGQPLSMHRWRSNIWLDGLAPWQEFEWIDREIKIGDVTLRIVQRADRCMNVQANPETGQRDLDVLGALEAWGHQDFSMLAEVTKSGTISVGDAAEVP